MRTKTIELFQYSELDDRAKEKARDWYRQGAFEYEWWDGVYEMADDAAKFLGFDIDRKGKHSLSIYFSGFSSQGDGACFTGTWRADKVDVAKLKAEWPEDKKLHQIVDGLAAIAAQNADGSAGIRHSGYYSHSGCTSFDMDAIEDEQEFKDLARSFMDWIYSALRSEYEYLSSDEQVTEAIEANGYEFNADGSIA